MPDPDFFTSCAAIDVEAVIKIANTATSPSP